MKNSRRVLVYGFGPYRQFENNITARMIRALPPRPGLKKVVFSVRFQRLQFVDSIERFRPDIILGLGQSSRRRIQIESQARNRRRASRSRPPRKISLRGPSTIKTTLPLRAAGQARRSSNAGSYVCNFSMYVMLEHIRRAAPATRYGFIHIPHDADMRKTQAWIEKILSALQTDMEPG